MSATEDGAGREADDRLIAVEGDGAFAESCEEGRVFTEPVVAVEAGVTQGGVVGKVTKVKDDSNEIEVEIASGVNVRVIRSTIATVMSKTEPAK